MTDFVQSQRHLKCFSCLDFGCGDAYVADVFQITESSLYYDITGFSNQLYSNHKDDDIKNQN